MADIVKLMPLSLIHISFNLPQIANLTCHDELDLASMGEKKVALFCCIPEDVYKRQDGERVAGICHYLDQDHAEINGMRWQMTEFALQMQIRGILFSPSMIE